MANDPLYIVSSDNPGMMLTNTPFNGGKFLGWIRTTKMVLGAKFNLGFVDGSLPKPAVIDKRIGYPDWYKGKKGKKQGVKMGTQLSTDLINTCRGTHHFRWTMRIKLLVLRWT
ncbi:retrovirus-related pol polyprotein from transposon TNT 1-94 [Tanacetum coccineum]